MKKVYYAFLVLLSLAILSILFVLLTNPLPAHRVPAMFEVLIMVSLLGFDVSLVWYAMQKSKMQIPSATVAQGKLLHRLWFGFVGFALLFVVSVVAFVITSYQFTLAAK